MKCRRFWYWFSPPLHYRTGENLTCKWLSRVFCFDLSSCVVQCWLSFMCSLGVLSVLEPCRSGWDARWLLRSMPLLLFAKAMIFSKPVVSEWSIALLTSLGQSSAPQVRLHASFSHSANSMLDVIRVSVVLLTDETDNLYTWTFFHLLQKNWSPLYFICNIS